MHPIYVSIFDRYSNAADYLSIDPMSNPVNLKQYIVEHFKKKKNRYWKIKKEEHIEEILDYDSKPCPDCVNVKTGDIFYISLIKRKRKKDKIHKSYSSSSHNSHGGFPLPAPFMFFQS